MKTIYLMATYFFHEETQPITEGEEKLVRYYYDDISAEILTRSFRICPAASRKEFLDNDRIALADLRADLKARLAHIMYRRAEAVGKAPS